jgi:hypothetical protein
MSTWIKLDRDVVKHWIFKDEWKFKCWIDLLVSANYSENKIEIKGVLLTCKRGELLYSLDSLSARWNSNKSKVRRFLKLLESDSMIELKSEQVTTRITICKYDSYQGERNADETQTKHKRNANETQTTPIKERKKKEERKEVNNTIPLLGEFLDYALNQKPTVDIEKVKRKYEAWKLNGWQIQRNNKLEPILNWKTTLNNTIPHLGEILVSNNGKFLSYAESIGNPKPNLSYEELMELETQNKLSDGK